ncbi:hypothetical protein DPMN_167034 [Dreissena polymorpha]|uniref:Uncharacterized protein n=1 Tax=Dreissena polymorpha TaxID=45954 RepID=A0A9D4IUN5_DREPO|nr:hypothetical protein DPMN_167034 [Dreissena polymorpha]
MRLSYIYLIVLEPTMTNRALMPSCIVVCQDHILRTWIITLKFHKELSEQYTLHCWSCDDLAANISVRKSRLSTSTGNRIVRGEPESSTIHAKAPHNDRLQSENVINDAVATYNACNRPKMQRSETG